MIAQQLDAATGLGGKSRTFGGETDKARIRIQKAIKRARDNICALIPTCAPYLDAVKTGENCYYEPDPAKNIFWKVKY